MTGDFREIHMMQEQDRTYSMDTLPQEFPCYGNGDFRSTAFAVENADGSMSCDLRYKSHEILDGKYNLEGLPAVYASDRGSTDTGNLNGRSGDGS